MARTIGILGGMSPESTIEYYQYITRRYTEIYGDYGYPEIIIDSVSFQPYVDWPTQGRWDLVTAGLVVAAKNLERAGVDFIVIATNTMHLVLDDIQAQIDTPILSLLDTVADSIEDAGQKRVGLLGTQFTMEKHFYQKALAKRGIEVLTPNADDRAFVNSVIYDELVAGEIRDKSRRGYLRVIDKLAQAGAEGIILGCTEIPLLVKATDTDLPLFDTTTIHAQAALDFSLA